MRCATLSTSGAIMWHGPHHAAQKSTRTGTDDLATAASNTRRVRHVNRQASAGVGGLTFATLCGLIKPRVLQPIRGAARAARHQYAVVVEFHREAPLRRLSTKQLECQPVMNFHISDTSFGTVSAWAGRVAEKWAGKRTGQMSDDRQSRRFRRASQGFAIDRRADGPPPPASAGGLFGMSAGALQLLGCSDTPTSPTSTTTTTTTTTTTPAHRECDLQPHPARDGRAVSRRRLEWTDRAVVHRRRPQRHPLELRGSVRHGGRRAADDRIDASSRPRRARRWRAGPSTSGSAIAKGGIRSTPQASRIRTTCVASRKPMRTAVSRSRRSIRAAMPAAGRTFTSRCFRASHPPPT